MPLAADDFLADNGGELAADWFALTPREEEGGAYADAPAKAAALLGQWIAKAEGKGYADAATSYDDLGAGAAYVYAAAYRYLLATTFAFEPSQGDVDEKGGYRREEWQVKRVEGRLAYWEARFAAASADSLTDPSGAGGAYATIRTLR